MTLATLLDRHRLCVFPPETFLYAEFPFTPESEATVTFTLPELDSAFQLFGRVDSCIEWLIDAEDNAEGLIELVMEVRYGPDL